MQLCTRYDKSGSTGIPECKFIERRRVKKPGQPRYPVQVSELFNATDFYVGARIELENFVFKLLDADEYTLHYMETRPDQVQICIIMYFVSTLLDFYYVFVL